MKTKDPSPRSVASFRLSTAATELSPYSPPIPRGSIDLFLDANEGPASDVDIGAVLADLPPDAIRRYPDASRLEQIIAERLQVDAEHVLVTAGADDAIDRVCRACLEPGRELILPVPTFEMIRRSALLAGAEVLTVPWASGPYPTEPVLSLISERTSMIAVVSPNNPTGAVAAASDLRRLSEAAPHAVLLVDLAYCEFADLDLTAAALSLPNALVTRTVSKALGLAGLRVGYAVGHPRLIQAMRATGGPYPVSALSLAVATCVLAQADDRLERACERVRTERNELAALLDRLGAASQPSQANFVLAQFTNAEQVWRMLGALGIAVRRFPSSPELKDALRITCPGDPSSFERLCHGLTAAARPEAILFDMDGVLADVSSSYRKAIALTAASFGVRVTPQDIAAAKAEGDANNDWILTHRLIRRAGVASTLEDVIARFEAFYHGAEGQPGLWEAETLIPARSTLEQLARKLPLGIVTGRPRRDCERFLRRFDLGHLFGAIVCMEDAPTKPDPEPVRLALRRLGVRHAWMIGDTPDDVLAARQAAAVPIGCIPPGSDPAELTAVLERCGAAHTLVSLGELFEMLA